MNQKLFLFLKEATKWWKLFLAMLHPTQIFPARSLKNAKRRGTQQKTVLLPSSSSRPLTKSECTSLGALVENDVCSWQRKGKAFHKVVEKLIVCQYLGSYAFITLSMIFAGDCLQ